MNVLHVAIFLSQKFPGFLSFFLFRDLEWQLFGTLMTILFLFSFSFWNWCLFSQMFIYNVEEIVDWVLRHVHHFINISHTDCLSHCFTQAFISHKAILICFFLLFALRSIHFIELDVLDLELLVNIFDWLLSSA